nr:MAG TPA: hypothetical protein [Caudoviricetes sp.]DAP11944.1 MAG TPA: hypothetical protein [Caudoviricetes sp.]
MFTITKRRPPVALRYSLDSVSVETRYTAF